MTYFIGIDLGTTNSAISLYDGKSTRILKSPQQNDVTPSALYFDRRGNKLAGQAAYDMAPKAPGNSALLFKRLMGTSTPIELTALKKTMTPVECSAEILKVLYSYLPEEIRNSPDTGTVITVPAAFNQMQKDATMEAASMAGLGKVALMQEPVAAVMSVMSKRDKDGMFLIYDLGGGTLDIAIAESIGGRVNLLAHGGIAMCGGRDMDRAIVDNIVRPWLSDNFNLPEDFSVNKQFQKLNRMLPWAVERAKIELSARESSVVALAETEVNMMDLNGDEIYLDVPISRDDLDRLIAEQIQDSIESARETITKAGISAMDLSDVVFVGGPTNYKPLRDKVAFELGINANTDVNPMTAVAEGASIFAESIDWSKEDRGRKGSRGTISTGGNIDLGFNYIARTPDRRARIVVQLKGQADAGSEFQIDSLDTGWTSGRLPLRHGEGLHVDLPQQGENTFKVFVFDPSGGSITIKNDRIVITRTAATIDAIPASHSLGIEVLDKLGGQPILEYLIRAGDSLPLKGTKMFKATESLKAGSVKSLNFKIWEGEIDSPISDNRMIGCLKISGTDFDDGIIPAGADLECTYEVLDSGNIKLEVSVPAIGGTFGGGKNFYSRQEGQMNFAESNAKIKAEAEETLERLDQMSEKVDSPKISQVRNQLQSALDLDDNETETERSQAAMEKVIAARKALAQIRKENLKDIRQVELDNCVDIFDKHIRSFAKPSEETAFDNQAKTAQRCIDRNDRDFESHLGELKGKSFVILFTRHDGFVISLFRSKARRPYNYTDRNQFNELVRMGERCIQMDDIEALRKVISGLWDIEISSSGANDMGAAVNIFRG